MAKVSINKKYNAESNIVNADNYDIKIDGQEVTEIFNGILSINLDLDAGEFPELHIRVNVDDIDADVEMEKLLKSR